MPASSVRSSAGRMFVNAPVALEVLDELVDVVDAAGDDVDREDDAAVAIDVRPHRRDAHVVGQRRLEAVEQLGPRERAPIDQLVGLPRVGGGDVDLLAGRRCRAAGPPARRRSAARASSREACVARRGVAARVAQHPRDVERGRRQHHQRDHRAARGGRRARCRTAGSRGWSGSRRHLGAIAQQQADQRRQRVEQRRRRGDAVGRAPPRCADRRSRPASPAAPRGCGAARRCRSACCDAGRGGAGQDDAREPAALQAILVVHRRLVHEIGERAVGFRGRGCGRRSGAGPRTIAIDA